MQKMKRIIITSLLFTFAFSGCRILVPANSGNYDWDEYKELKEAERPNCSDIEICMSESEMERWVSDSLGILGIRRKSFPKMFEILQNGRLDGITYDCLNTLLGPPNDSSTVIEAGRFYTYNISNDHDSIIHLSFFYNEYFDAILNTHISIRLEDSSFEISNCESAFFTYIDSLIDTTYFRNPLPGNYLRPVSESRYFMDFLLNPTVLGRYDFSENEHILNPEFQNIDKITGGCVLCYLGEPEYYLIRYYSSLEEEISHNFVSLNYKLNGPRYCGLNVILSGESLEVKHIRTSVCAIP